MEKKIISVGYDIPGHSALYCAYSSDRSLLDADIVVFAPDFTSYEVEGHYKGKPLYDENDSFRLQEHTRHWRHELSTALETGKTVFVFFTKYEEFYVLTGRRQYSSAAKTARATRVVDQYDNYKFFPAELGRIIPKEGEGIVFAGNPAFSTFWSEFKNDLTYKSYIDGKVSEPLFLTKTGEKVVGALFHLGRGNLILLPVIHYDEDAFTKYDGKKNVQIWTKEAIQFGKRLIQAIVDIDKALRSGDERTPAPTWIDESEFALAITDQLRTEIDKTSKKLDELVTRKTALIQRLDQETALKDLLFEKGKRLENAILSALKILGYQAENYDDGELELDCVILSPEGDRFIGEAEGKDGSAISIDKLRQLALNIQEDVQREEITEPAVGILFGNGHRLTKPSERDEQFTDKCVRTAKGQNHILIRTSDLFRVARYIQESRDNDFCKKCRDCIKDGRGTVVRFPDTPNPVPNPSTPSSKSSDN